MFRLCLLPFFALAIAGLSAGAADPAAPAAPQTVMLIPGKLLLNDPLGTAFSSDWKVAKGRWEAVDGAMRGAEIKEDMHGAVARRNLELKDAVIAFSFKLDGTKMISLSLNGAKGHISRVRIAPNGVTVQKDDQDGKKGDDKAAVLNTAAVTIEPGKWHTMVVELRGADILATLDGKQTAFGSHPTIAAAKANFGLTVAGESASFKDFKVWEATGPVKDWETIRAKLVAETKK